MSEVIICNLALSNIGDTATVASIKPPDASIQAQLCARFYPVARDALLEMGSWGFATRRTQLAEVECQGMPHTWRHAYALPSATINVIAVLPQCSPDDYEAWFGPVEQDHFPPYPQGYLPVPGAPLYTPQPYAVETLSIGTQVVLTNTPCAVLRYTMQVTDTTKFSPLFVLALSWLLSSMLAGPIIKGDEGRAAAKGALEMFELLKGQASASDANQRKTHIEPAVSWVRGR